MTGSVVRIVALIAATIASAIGVWKVHSAVGARLGSVGGILGALVVALTLGSLLWIAAVASKPQCRAHPRKGPAGKVRR
jgi:hypothetical protein